MHSTMHGDEKTCGFVEGRLHAATLELRERYNRLIRNRRVQWTTYHALERELGSGGQGIVYLSARRGADGFHLPVAMKVMSPERFVNAQAYQSAMERMARVASQVATIQHDNLIDVHDFVDRNSIRIMVMEWVDGQDVRQLMNWERLQLVQQTVGEKWNYINRVVATFGPEQTRFKAGIAVAIIRECLAALAALHRANIIHGDIKPANVMIKRTGHAKLIDIGSAFELSEPPASRTCTPTYAAPEVLEGGHCSPKSDLTSLGYVLIEMLSGRPCFPSDLDLSSLLEAKRTLPNRLEELLPPEVTCNALLVNFCRKLIVTDPVRRFASARDAELAKDGAAAFHRQLVFGDLASEYEHDLQFFVTEMSKVEQLAITQSLSSMSSTGDLEPESNPIDSE
jgi:eukaryotic-like serine/threonine-protein kinase